MTRWLPTTSLTARLSQRGAVSTAYPQAWTRRLAVEVVAIAYWLSFGLPPLSVSRQQLIPTGRSAADDPALYWIGGALYDVDPRVWIFALAVAAFAFTLWRVDGWLHATVLVLSAGPAIHLGASYWVAPWAIWTGLFATPAGSAVVGVVAGLFRASAGLPLVAWSFRDWRLGIMSLGASVILATAVGGHVLWHTAYIGLGWYPNPYGIRYLDASGVDGAERIDPAALYASPEYEAALRREVFRIAGADPGFVVTQALVKVAEAIRHAAPWVLLLPLALYRRPALFVPGLLTLGPIILAGPFRDFEGGWMAFVLAAPVLALSLPRRVPAVSPQGAEAVEVLDVPASEEVRRPGRAGVVADPLPIE